MASKYKIFMNFNKNFMVVKTNMTAKTENLRDH